MVSAQKKLPPFISYSPSKDHCFGQAGKRRAIADVVDSVSTFIEKFTVDGTIDGLAFQIYRPYPGDSKKVHHGFFDAVGSFLEKKISRGPPRLIYDTFEVDLNRFDEALAFMVDHHPWPKLSMGSVSLAFTYHFYWKNPKSGRRFPGQGLSPFGYADSRSNISFEIQTNSFMQPDLYFHGDLLNSKVKAMIRNASKGLPLKLNPKHFRLFHAKANGTDYTSRRLQPAELLVLEKCLVDQ